MGALTLKSFPFEIRGWDIEKFESFDPTDGFGFNTKVYMSKNQIIQIEPDYNNYNSNIWLTDKGRQFFDAIFKNWNTNDMKVAKIKFWSKLLYKIIKTIYIFDHCNKHKNKNHFFTIVCNNLSFEILSILIVISQNYSFIKLRKIEDSKLNVDLESDFQLNHASNKNQLNLSNLCLLISTNLRYEGYYLNLSLRQRIFKGNFKCLLVGSLIDLTFPVSFLGSNMNVVKTILEGNNLVCQDLTLSENSILIYNSELFKRNNNDNIIKNIQMLCYSTIFEGTWNGFNLLNPSLAETTFFNLKQIPKLSSKDLSNFSLLYFLNITMDSSSNIKKIIELKFLKLISLTLNQKNYLFFDQNSQMSHNRTYSLLLETNYAFIPSSNFYENEETYINTEGIIKRTTNVISTRKSKNNWQILRKLLKSLNSKLVFWTQKDNQILFFNSQKFSIFKNFIMFQYYPIQILSSLNFYLNLKNKSIVLNKIKLKFKSKTIKFIGSKLKYWLDDFFSGGKDEYSQNSVVLANCSKILKLRSSNFI